MRQYFKLTIGLVIVCYGAIGSQASFGETPYQDPRCQLVPMPDHQLSFRIDGIEKTRWHFSDQYPRPFLFPLNGPSGVSLTRMGHPGAPNHDHHRSVWFAYHRVEGNDFWADGTGTKIRQKTWKAYKDGNDEAIMASELGWYDSKDEQLLSMDVVIAIRPMEAEEYAIEVQATIRPAGSRTSVELQKTNFGLLAVRVAKSISEHFGGGRLTSSEGLEGEPQIFGKRARWMDYSGPITAGRGNDRTTVTEGITFHDHPSNPNYPNHWHVRSDGWMGCSIGMKNGLKSTREKPLVIRFLLHSHRDGCDAKNNERIHKEFCLRPGFVVSKSKKPHLQFEVSRVGKLKSFETSEK